MCGLRFKTIRQLLFCIIAAILAVIVAPFVTVMILMVAAIGPSEQRGDVSPLYTEGDCVLGTEFWASRFDVSWRVAILCAKNNRSRRFQIVGYKDQAQLIRNLHNPQRSIHLCDRDFGSESHQAAFLRQFHRFSEQHDVFPLHIEINRENCWHGSHRLENEDDVLLQYDQIETLER